MLTFSVANDFLQRTVMILALGPRAPAQAPGRYMALSPYPNQGGTHCTPHSTINIANEGRFVLNVDSPYGERAQSTVLTCTPPPPPPRRPARLRRDFIFNLSMRESKASIVVVCLHHSGGRTHFRLGVSSYVGHCCQHFRVGWRPNRIKGGLRRGMCQRDKQALQSFLGRLQLEDADVQGFQNSTSLLPSCGKSFFWMCTERRTYHLDKHGRRCMKVWGWLPCAS